MHVHLFIPCFVDQLFPQTAFNMVKVLKQLGCIVHYNTEQTCCGQPAYNAGYVNECRSVAEKFYDDFAGNEYIVAPGGSCTGFVRNYYDKVLSDQEGKRNSLNVYEFTEFLTTVLKVEDLGAEFNASAVYHDACGALRECGIKEGPRRLLSHVRGLNLMEAPDCEVCCGFGGTFAVKFEPISIGMGEQKVLNAIAMGAEYIISTDLSCLLHLDGYIRKHELNVKTIHIADILSRTVSKTL